ncbi:MAG: ATP-binding cassette domain-containing protein [Eubacteriales bacterium]|nr:ATP-binding cassette domain-containing protein [Eubacteriales bacterium]
MQLVVNNITKSFGEKEVLHGVSFTVESGRAMGFLGRNGAGKSTTIRCLMDVFHPDSGNFLLDGSPFKPRSLKIGYLPEERGMYQKNGVLAQLTYFAMLRGASMADAAASANHWIDYFGLGEYKNKKLETLSKGNQQKIQIAQSFLNEPNILILDEPFSGLDPVNAQIFQNAINEFVKEGRLVIFSSHQMSYVEEVCDDVTLIHNGDILLSGDLDLIKLEEGRDKLFLSVLSGDTAWEKALSNAFPALGIIPGDDGLILDTKGRVSQGDIMRWLNEERLTVRRFGLYEPSLNDIFIKKAGD